MFKALPALEVPNLEGCRSLSNKEIGSISEKEGFHPGVRGHFDSRTLNTGSAEGVPETF